jgi:hypothetical protein
MTWFLEQVDRGEIIPVPQWAEKGYLLPAGRIGSCHRKNLTRGCLVAGGFSWDVLHKRCPRFIVIAAKKHGF